jgi:hypothetical protein
MKTSFPQKRFCSRAQTISSVQHCALLISIEIEGLKQYNISGSGVKRLWNNIPAQKNIIDIDGVFLSRIISRTLDGEVR